MTDFEMLSEFNEYWDTVFMIFSVYVTVTFAFLVASYMVADKLKSGMVWVVIGLYTISSVWLNIGMNRFAAMAGLVGAEIKRSVINGQSSLNWTTLMHEPDYVLSLASYLIMVFPIFIYIGALIFFFYQRHKGLEIN